MSWETIAGYSEDDFKRYTGVSRKTFELMVEALEEGERKKKESGALKIDDKCLKRGFPLSRG
jgi:hypothetical protein